MCSCHTTDQIHHLSKDDDDDCVSAVSDDPASSHALSQPLATSCAGIFAVGDVRSGSIKRVASAVGEGAIVVASVHQALAVL